MGGGELLTLGHHTYSHPIFNNLTFDQIKQDINYANTIFKDNFGFIPSHFAYPFGSRIEVSKEHFSLIENLGFKSAVTTRSGSIYASHKHHLYALPRIFFSDDFKIESTYNIRKSIVVSN